jgi:hypothetical protein
VKKFFQFLLFGALSLFFAADVFSADFTYSNFPQSTVAGSEFKIDFLVDANIFPLNAVAGKIIFTSGATELKSIETGSSQINFWVESPVNTAPGEKSFSGIVPNGFEGKIALFSAIFKANTTGTITFDYAELQALLNDGLGSEDTVTQKKLSITITPLINASVEQKIISLDREPPDIFFPEVVRNQNLFDGDNTLIFKTEDKQSGIDHYNVLEKVTYNFFGREYSFGIWKQATSPYRLDDQKRHSEIFVRATDRQGNERIVRLPAQSPVRWYENRLIWSIIIVLGATILACLLFYAGTRKKKHL